MTVEHSYNYLTQLSAEELSHADHPPPHEAAAWRSRCSHSLRLRSSSPRPRPAPPIVRGSGSSSAATRRPSGSVQRARASARSRLEGRSLPRRPGRRRRVHRLVFRLKVAEQFPNGEGGICAPLKGRIVLGAGSADRLVLAVAGDSCQDGGGPLRRRVLHRARPLPSSPTAAAGYARTTGAGRVAALRGRGSQPPDDCHRRDRRLSA